jgi:integrase
MPKTKQPFSLYKRTTTKKNKFIYYVQFRDDKGEYMTGMSTGETSKAAAANWANEYLKEGFNPKTRNLTFRKYAENWWVWDKCSYVRYRLARGFSVSRRYVEESRRNLDLRLIPAFGDMRLNDIKPQYIQSWMLELLNDSGLSGATINRSLATLKVMLGQAVLYQYIPRSPAEKIGILKENTKQKDILTLSEVKTLFDEQRLERNWKNSIEHYTLNLLAAATGLRLGEIQGLQKKSVFQTHVCIVQAYARKYGMKDPKWNSQRMIPIPRMVSEYLQLLIENSQFQDPDSLLFAGKDQDTPIEHKAILAVLYHALKEIGITREIRKNRNVTFHSWRHFFNTICRAKVPDSILQRLTGHRTQEMTEHYTHFRLEDFRDVVKIQESIFES